MTKISSFNRFGDEISSPISRLLGTKPAMKFKSQLSCNVYNLTSSLFCWCWTPGILLEAKGWFAFVRLIVSLNIDVLELFEARFGNRFQKTLLKQLYIHERAIPD